MSDNQTLRVAILEDDSVLSGIMSEWITDRGYQCEVFQQAEEFQRRARKTSFDVVTIDWDLPEITGLEVLKWMRQSLASDVPAVFVSSRRGEQNIVAAFEAGADDYIIKPVMKLEFLVRISAVARRAKPATEILEFSPFIVDTGNRFLTVSGKYVPLTEKEYDLALFLLRNQGPVLSRDHLLTSVWGTSVEVTTRTVDTHMSRLRKKLKLSATGKWKITSVYQHGYRFQQKFSM